MISTDMTYGGYSIPCSRAGIQLPSSRFSASQLVARCTLGQLVELARPADDEARRPWMRRFTTEMHCYPSSKCFPAVDRTPPPRLTRRSPPISPTKPCPASPTGHGENMNDWPGPANCLIGFTSTAMTFQPGKTWLPRCQSSATANLHYFVCGFLAASSHVPVQAANIFAMRTISRRAAFFVGNSSPSVITMPLDPV